jgi:alpha-L-rhamnosidase
LVISIFSAPENYPSWGWWIKNGMTTLSEGWSIDNKESISLNHIIFGEISAWMCKAPGGIRTDSASPGFKHILLQPHLVKGLDTFYCEHEGPYGKIISSWKRKNDVIVYEVTIPPGSTASMVLEGNKNNLHKILTAGHYEFIVQ